MILIEILWRNFHPCMKGPGFKSRGSRKDANILTFPSRLKVSNAKKEAQTDDNKSNANAIKLRNKLFDPRKRFKGNSKELKERIRNPNSLEITTQIPRLPVDHPVSPFPNFPMIHDSISNDVDVDESPILEQSLRDGRVVEAEIPNISPQIPNIDSQIPNIGFEELQLTPKQPEVLEAEIFMPILRPDTSGRQEFPSHSAVPSVSDLSPIAHFPATTPASPQAAIPPVSEAINPSQTPVKARFECDVSFSKLVKSKNFLYSKILSS